VFNELADPMDLFAQRDWIDGGDQTRGATMKA
jgi:hypothetical protein